ncbi:hypothetical protein ACLI09_17560 [Flavobacterium sp. RHBU_24]|uniref:hypothetical protein n=1 Tax=Flavobacterium sp. RHBU_24 TaxID=3391185 RepID=UPI00398563C3
MVVMIAGTPVDIVKLPFNGRSVRYMSGDTAPADKVIKFLEGLTARPVTRWIAAPHQEFRKKLLITGVSFND